MYALHHFGQNRKTTQFQDKPKLRGFLRNIFGGECGIRTRMNYGKSAVNA
jgi:hypothetical protein